MPNRRIFTRANGEPAFASSTREWFGMAPTTNEAMTSDELLASTGMDGMQLTEHPIEAVLTPHGSLGRLSVPFDSHKAIMLEEIAAEKLSPVTVVAKSREVFQFNELMDPLQDVVNTTHGTLEAGGLIAGGAEWFAFLKLPEGVSIAGESHDMFLMARDGLRSAFSLGGLHRRLACMNMFPAAIAEAKTGSRYVLQHRHGAKVSTEAMRAVVSIAYASATLMDDRSKVLLDQETTDNEFLKIVDHLMGVPADDAGDRAIRNHAKRNAKMISLLHGETVAQTWRHGKPNHWSAFQAITEYADHVTPTRGRDSQRRMERIVDGTFNRLKADALDVLS